MSPDATPATPATCQLRFVAVSETPHVSKKYTNNRWCSSLSFFLLRLHVHQQAPLSVVPMITIFRLLLTMTTGSTRNVYYPLGIRGSTKEREAWREQTRSTVQIEVIDTESWHDLHERLEMELRSMTSNDCIW